jgi:hypothetical protein
MQTIVYNPSLAEAEVALPPAARPFEPEGSSNTGGIVVGVVLGLFAVAGLAFGVWVLRKRREVRRNRGTASTAPMPSEYVPGP